MPTSPSFTPRSPVGIRSIGTVTTTSSTTTSTYVAPFISASSGMVIPSYADILSDLISNYQAIYSQVVYLGTDTAKYQELSIFALKISNPNLAMLIASDVRLYLYAITTLPLPSLHHYLMLVHSYYSPTFTISNPLTDKSQLFIAKCLASLYELNMIISP